MKILLLSSKSNTMLTSQNQHKINKKDFQVTECQHANPYMAPRTNINI